MGRRAQSNLVLHVDGNLELLAHFFLPTLSSRSWVTSRRQQKCAFARGRFPRDLASMLLQSRRRMHIANMQVMGQSEDAAGTTCTNSLTFSKSPFATAW